MAVSNQMIIPQGSVNAIPLNIADNWARTVGSVAVSSVAPSTVDPALVVLTCAGGATFTIRASDYAAALFANAVPGAGAGVPQATPWAGWCIARMEQLGDSIGTIMGNTSRFASK